MATVLDEVTSDTVATIDVEKRVSDWEKRINDLYGRVIEWLPHGWRKKNEQRFVQMHETMMKEHGVGPKKLPILEFEGPNGVVAQLEPRGLWIIGANGRIDLRIGSEHYVIVDRADNFAQPEWDFARFADRGHTRPFSAQVLQAALSP